MYCAVESITSGPKQNIGGNKSVGFRLMIAFSLNNWVAVRASFAFTDTHGLESGAELLEMLRGTS